MITPLLSARRIAAAAFLACILPVATVRAALCTPDFGSVFEGLDDNVIAIYTNGKAFGPLTFSNNYSVFYYDTNAYESWNGFAISRASDTDLGHADLNNQFSACCTGKTAYAIAFDGSGDWEGAPLPPTIEFAVPAIPVSCELALTTYTLGSILNGDTYARPFADGDHFDLTVSAYDAGGYLVGATIVPLADYRGGTPLLFTNWTEVALAVSSPVSRLVFTLSTTDMSWGYPNTPFYFALGDLSFRYAGGEEGISQDDDDILSWATVLHHYERGANLSDKWANPYDALGAPGQGIPSQPATNGLVSLGDGGTITVGFPLPLRDGPGPDFAVFENGMHSTLSGGYFLELAQVEVSSDGTNFVRFPCHSLETNEQVRGSYDNLCDTTAYGGLAGTTLQGWGNAFDLAALPASDLLDTGHVTHVRIRDVTGDGSVLDDWGNPIYDPDSPPQAPTPLSGGFDLSGVGALNLAIEITLAADEPPPALPGFTTMLEWNNDLSTTNWIAVETKDAPGFYRWRLLRDAE